MIVELPATALYTADELSRRDELAERLRWLVRLRWVALAGVCVAVAVARGMDLVENTWPLAAITASMGVLNLGFHGLHMRLPVRTLRALSAEALLQIAVDVVGLGLLILFAGGLSNPFVFYFTFHVVIAAILLERRQAYTVALMTAAMVLVLGIAEEMGLGTSRLTGYLAAPPATTLSRFGKVFAVGTTMVISVYMVTAIMDRLRAHSRDVRRLNHDLAERVEMLAAAEKKLAAEHQRARAILECMDEGVIVVDLQGKVLLANTAAQKSSMLALEDTLRQAGCRDVKTGSDGFCHGPLSGGSLLQHHHEHAPAPAHEQQNLSAEQAAQDSCPLGSPSACLQEALAKGGMLCPATLALLGADAPKAPAPPLLTPPKSPMLAQIELQGRRFENTVSAVRTEDQGTLGLVIVARDVTQRSSLERQVVHAEKLHALGNLAAGVAHELNTPLGTILGYAQILLDEESSSPPAPKELKAIEDQARRCRKIVQGLLDFARKSSGGREECAPNELVLRVRDLIAHSLEMRGIALRVNLAEPPPPKVHAAVNEIEQVLVNLITNAADAIEMAVPAAAASGSSGARAGGPRGGAAWTEGCITIQTRVEARGVLIAVEDNGPGVPPELAEQIFEPFYTTKAAGRGTGLGLSIAHRIIEDHNGSLRLTRRAGGESGARFEVRLTGGGEKDTRTGGATARNG